MKVIDDMGRKFVLGALILIAGTIIVLWGRLPAESWIELAKWIMGLFVVGNVAEKFSPEMKRK